jgi:hypothetical protein
VNLQPVQSRCAWASIPGAVFRVQTRTDSATDNPCAHLYPLDRTLQFPRRVRAVYGLDFIRIRNNAAERDASAIVRAVEIMFRIAEIAVGPRSLRSSTASEHERVAVFS